MFQLLTLSFRTFVSSLIHASFLNVTEGLAHLFEGAWGLAKCADVKVGALETPSLKTISCHI